MAAIDPYCEAFDCQKDAEANRLTQKTQSAGTSPQAI